MNSEFAIPYDFKDYFRLGHGSWTRGVFHKDPKSNLTLVGLKNYEEPCVAFK